MKIDTEQRNYVVERAQIALSKALQDVDHESFWHRRDELDNVVATYHVLCSLGWERAGAGPYCLEADDAVMPPGRLQAMVRQWIADDERELARIEQQRQEARGLTKAIAEDLAGTLNAIAMGLSLVAPDGLTAKESGQLAETTG